MEYCSGKRTVVLLTASITLLKTLTSKIIEIKLLWATCYLDVVSYFFLTASQEIPDFPLWEGMSVVSHLYLVY